MNREYLEKVQEPIEAIKKYLSKKNKE